MDILGTGTLMIIMSSDRNIIGESKSSTISHINLGVKHIGKRSAGKLHAAFEEAGAGNGLTAPALDPTPYEKKCINHIILLGIRGIVEKPCIPANFQ